MTDATGYGPGNYYSSTSFINGSSSYRNDWTTVQNDNLWGNTTNTFIARQGPCASGYHVPSNLEWSWIVTAGGWDTSQDGANMQTALKLPYTGRRNWNNGAFGYGGSYGYYWSSSLYGINGSYLLFNSSVIYPGNSNNRAYGVTVRCFKN